MTLKTPKSWHQGLTDSEGKHSLSNPVKVELMCWTTFYIFVIRYHDIDVDPCTKYVVKVQASEDYQVQNYQIHQIQSVNIVKYCKDQHKYNNFQGRREDFKAVSLEVHHKVHSPNNLDFLQIHIWSSLFDWMQQLIFSFIARLTTPHASCPNHQSRFFSPSYRFDLKISLTTDQDSFPATFKSNNERI